MNHQRFRATTRCSLLDKGNVWKTLETGFGQMWQGLCPWTCSKGLMALVISSVEYIKEHIQQVLAPVVEVDLLPDWEVIHQRTCNEPNAWNVISQKSKQEQNLCR